MADHGEAFIIIEVAELMRGHADPLLESDSFSARVIGMGMLLSSLRYLTMHYQDIDSVIEVLRAQANEIERQHNS